MTNSKFAQLIFYIILFFAIPFFLMIYCLKCERLRLSGQKRLIERLVEQQRHQRHEEEARYRDLMDISNDLPERY